MTSTNPKFYTGQTAFHIGYGKVKVVDVNVKKVYAVRIEGGLTFTIEGFAQEGHIVPQLYPMSNIRSLEIIDEGKVVLNVEKWKWVYTSLSNTYQVSSEHYASEEDFKKANPNCVPVQRIDVSCIVERLDA